MAANAKSSKLRKSAAKVPKQKRQRSPNYPILALGKAVEKTQQLITKSQTHYCPLGLAQRLWGYTEFSSTGDQAVAALRAFGLVEVSGAGRARQVKVSDVGRRIVLNAMDKGDLLKQSALRPAIHAELWQKYNGNIPGDELIRHYLAFDRPDGTFNMESVGGFIARFRETIAFANLTPTDTIPMDAGSDEDEDEEPLGEPNPSFGPVITKPPITPKKPPMNLSTLPLPLPLDDGTITIVNIPKMSETVFKFFKAQLEAYKSAIVQKPASAAESNDVDPPKAPAAP